MVIRPFRPETDTQAVIALLHTLNRHEATLGAARDERYEGAAACLENDIREAGHSGGELHVAEESGVVIGYIGMAIGKAGPYIPADIRDHVHVENLVVAETHRQRGIGKALLAKADELARLRRLRSITLGVVSGNTPAEETYRRAGFKPSSIEMRRILD
jgi:ribosomal protein S18 acetylase RimI-like enzyme